MNKIKIKKGLISQKIGNKLKIFDGEESILYTLNASASFIFEKLKAGTRREKLIEQLVKKYAISVKRAEKDSDSLIGLLAGKNIIEKD